MNISIFASHGGSNLQALIDACQEGKIKAKVCAVISNNKNSNALKRAEKANISKYYLSRTVIKDKDELDKKILEVLINNNTDIIILAGYMRKLSSEILHKYKNRVFNIHPSLLPLYGGKGMYGIFVHKAVIESGDKVSGVTIHRVDAEYDTGEIVAQVEVPVLLGDTPETLGKRVLEKEHTVLVKTLSNIINGTINTQ